MIENVDKTQSPRSDSEENNVKTPVKRASCHSKLASNTGSTQATDGLGESNRHRPVHTFCMEGYGMTAFGCQVCHANEISSGGRTAKCRRCQGGSIPGADKATCVFHFCVFFVQEKRIEIIIITIFAIPDAF